MNQIWIDTERFDALFNHIFDLVAKKIGVEKTGEQIDAILGAVINVLYCEDEEI